MKFETLTLIKNFENQLKQSYSLPIFKGYKAINKRNIEKIIDEIYSNLPNDIILAQEILKQKSIEYKKIKNDEIYLSLKNVKKFLNNSFTLSNFIIIYIKDLDYLINSIEQNVPEEISKAQNLN